MTRLRVGYDGQRYEVRATRRGHSESMAYGWTTENDGGALFKSVSINPGFQHPVVVDLFAEHNADRLAELRGDLANEPKRFCVECGRLAPIRACSKGGCPEGAEQ